MQASGLTALFPMERDNSAACQSTNACRGPGRPSRFRRRGRGTAPHRRRPSLGDVLPACPPDGDGSPGITWFAVASRCCRCRSTGMSRCSTWADGSALYTGWDRRVVAVDRRPSRQGTDQLCADLTVTGNPQEILDAAPATVQRPRTVHLIRPSSCPLDHVPIAWNRVIAGSAPSWALLWDCAGNHL